jgi:hypothetical protein
LKEVNFRGTVGSKNVVGVASFNCGESLGKVASVDDLIAEFVFAGETGSSGADAIFEGLGPSPGAGETPNLSRSKSAPIMPYRNAYKLLNRRMSLSYAIEKHSGRGGLYLAARKICF